MRLSCTLAALALLVPLAVAFSGLGHDLKRQTCAWSFDESKGNGPSNWGTICNGAYPVCASGQQQSPIDVITSNDIERPLSNRKITVKYPELVEAEFENTGYTLEVVTPLTALAYVTVAGLGNFDLLQFHFHTPSEHRLNGAIYPAEMHLVHKSKAGVYTVIGFFIAEGTDNSVLTPLIDNLANVNDAKENITLDRLTLENLITSAFTYYSYNGSFTTPPCTEGVNWVLSDTPLFVSNSQLTALVAALKGAASAPSSNRPAQPLNGRLVTTYIASAGALSVSALLAVMLAVVALML